LWHGAREEVQAHFNGLGYGLQPGQDMADFLLQVRRAWGGWRAGAAVSPSLSHHGAFRPP
jgi:hypothetical protein